MRAKIAFGNVSKQALTNSYVNLSHKSIIINMGNIGKEALIPDIKLIFKCFIKKRFLAADS